LRRASKGWCHAEAQLPAGYGGRTAKAFFVARPADMKVRVKLFASLKKYLPRGASDDTITVEVPEGATVAEVVGCLGISPEHAKMAVTGECQVDMETPVQDGQQVNLFPPLAGGS
jgi:molybdopterin converting factor small subunit